MHSGIIIQIPAPRLLDKGDIMPPMYTIPLMDNKPPQLIPPPTNLNALIQFQFIHRLKSPPPIILEPADRQDEGPACLQGSGLEGGWELAIAFEIVDWRLEVEGEQGGEGGRRGLAGREGQDQLQVGVLCGGLVAGLAGVDCVLIGTEEALGASHCLQDEAQELGYILLLKNVPVAAYYQPLNVILYLPIIEHTLFGVLVDIRDVVCRFRLVLLLGYQGVELGDLA
jgi:hypothetical protein